MHGSGTLFIGMLPLGIARSFLLVDTFKIWAVIIVFGTMHALLFLPALLAIVGPLNSYEEEEGEYTLTIEKEGTKPMKNQI